MFLIIYLCIGIVFVIYCRCRKYIYYCILPLHLGITTNVASKICLYNVIKSFSSKDYHKQTDYSGYLNSQETFIKGTYIIVQLGPKVPGHMFIYNI